MELRVIGAPVAVTFARLSDAFGFLETPKGALHLCMKVKCTLSFLPFSNAL